MIDLTRNSSHIEIPRIHLGLDRTLAGWAEMKNPSSQSITLRRSSAIPGRWIFKEPLAPEQTRQRPSTGTADQVMSETLVNPVIEGSLWAYKVSFLLRPKILEKTDAYILLLGKGDRRCQAGQRFPQGSRQKCTKKTPVVLP